MNYLRFLILTILIVGFGCNQKPSSESEAKKPVEQKAKIEKHDLLVYGSLNCSHCIKFTDKLRADGIEFTFYDVDNSDAHWQEMYNKVKAIDYKGYVSFPIVDARGKIFVNPKVEEVMASLNQQK